MNALDDVSVHLQLRDDSGGEGNPGGVQFGKSDGLVAGLAQSVQQPLLLGVKETHLIDRIVALRRGCRTQLASGRPAVALSAKDPRSHVSQKRDFMNAYLQALSANVTG
jgi:hypothetical protein